MVTNYWDGGGGGGCKTGGGGVHVKFWGDRKSFSHIEGEALKVLGLFLCISLKFSHTEGGGGGGHNMFWLKEGGGGGRPLPVINDQSLIFQREGATSI